MKQADHAPPESIPAAIPVLFFLSLCAFLAVCDVLSAPVGEYDEGITLVGSMLVSKGLLPYRDFWSIYPPLGYYVTALWFNVAGMSVIPASGAFCFVERRSRG